MFSDGLTHRNVGVVAGKNDTGLKGHGAVFLLSKMIWLLGLLLKEQFNHVHEKGAAKWQPLLY